MNIEQLKKIKALADDPRGVPSERKAAREILEKMLVKLNKQESELEEVVRTPRYIPFQRKYEVLTRQMIYHCAAIESMSQYRYKMAFEAMMTDDEYLLFKFLFAHYKRAYNKELKLFEKAFVVSNDLFAMNSTPVAQEDVTAEQLEEWLEIRKRAAGIANYSPKRQLKESPEPERKMVRRK